MPTRRSSRVQVGGSRYSYGARVVPIAAPAKNATSSSSRSDPEYVAAQLRNIMTVRDHQALTDLQAGKLIPFITYAEERVKHPLDSDDEARWQKLLYDSHQKAEENAVAEGVAAGEITLETARFYLKNQRDKYEPSDPRFADLSTQLSDVNNAIAARDFNGELNTAIADMIEAGNTVAAKEKYLRKLIGVLPRAKDDKARTTLQNQMLDLQDAIKTDRINARGAETSAKLVDYYDGKISGPEVMAHLREMAATALDDQEARAYATAASQVETRERTRARAAVGRAASGGGGRAGSAATAVTTALAPLTKATKDAAAIFTATVKRAGNPDAEAFKTFREASQVELDAIEQALTNASPAAAEALIKRREALLDDANTRQRAAATKTLQTQRDQAAAFKDTLDTLRKSGAPYEETSALAAGRIGTVKAARALPWLQGYEEDPTLGGDLARMEAETRKMLTDEAAISTGILTGETPTTKNIKKEYKNYADFFVGKGIEPPLGLDEWVRAMVQEKDVKSLSGVLQLPTDAANLEKTRMWQADVRTMWESRHQEVQGAADRLSAAAWPRNDSGTRIPYSAPVEGEGTPGPGGRPAYFDPTRGGLFDPNVFGPLVGAHQRGGAQQDYTGATAGAGVAPPAITKGAGMASVPPEQDPQQLEETNQQMIDAQRRAKRAAMDPHDAADDYLNDFTPIIYPTWEIPALPDWGAFSGIHFTEDSSDYMPPALPSYGGSTFQLPTLPAFQPAPFNPQGPSFDAGASYAPPPPPSGGGAQGGGTTPMLTA